MAFRAYGSLLTNVADFKCLGCILTPTDNDCPAAVENLRKAGRKWERMSRIIGWEGVNVQTYGKIFKAVVQEVLLLGSETWMVLPRTGRTLGSFHHIVESRLMGHQPRRFTYGIW